MGNLITELPVSEMNATIELLDRLGIDREGLKRFRKASTWEQTTIAGMIQNGISEVQKATLVPVPRPFILIVDYNLPFAEMVALGHYDWVNDNITSKRFPIVGEGVVRYEAKLFQFGYAISFEDAQRRIQKEDVANPWAFAKTEHGLAFGAQNPEEQRNGSILVLDSMSKFGEGRYVLSLHARGSKRGLGLSWCTRAWDGHHCFLVVRKVVTPS